mmetsp:Transcript_3828/g.5844  ORF Transcript_3828/g.5844 Transcript_3828/m.5844 type:complete len:301 (-) Transcript_3828:176-1078(-)
METSNEKGSSHVMTRSLLGHIRLKKGAPKIIPSSLGGGNKRSLTVGSRSNILDTIKVLSQEQEIKRILGSRSLHTTSKVHDGTLESIHNGLSLLRNSHSAQVLGFSLCFCRFNLENLLSLSSFRHGIFETLGRVNLIHGILHSLIRIKIRNKTLKNLVSILCHGFTKSTLDSNGKIFLGLEYSVQLQVRQFGTQNIEDVGGNLSPGISQCIERLKCLFLQNLELDGYYRGEEYVVERFSFDTDIKLLHTVGHAADHFFDAANEESETGGSEAFEFSKGFDYSYFRGRYCEWNETHDLIKG